VRVVYQLHTHDRPAQVARLVGRLLGSSPSCLVVVSHDQAAASLPLDETDERLTVLRTKGGYGDFSHVDRYMQVATWLEDRGIAYDWMTNLSGQDYPARRLADIEGELADSPYDGYVEHFPLFGPDSHWSPQLARTRYFFAYHRVPWLRRHAARLRLLGGVNRVQPWVRISPAYGAVGRRTSAPFTSRWPAYGGSFWTTLRADTVRHLVTFTRDNPDIVRYFRRTLAPEEAYVNTVLANSPEVRLSGDCRRYFDFSRTWLNHPRTLGMTDLPAIQRSGAHFARKFDLAVDPAVLDALDAVESSQ
jgi:hypothetical protein